MRRRYKCDDISYNEMLLQHSAHRERFYPSFRGEEVPDSALSPSVSISPPTSVPWTASMVSTLALCIS
jgi:hypothetical protein